ncbi:hypothetical protein BTN49_1339 [Candidatus Enterovibrio escicola]|uniref:Uncharacterized protein n=1 Tax=Candidatus Enterovibrio escicola TaxID=1927127 RepID=A0A2A5T4E0_9GAMM|nr:S24/S26 family peptidase [Candidatus Enterovibrio escacola]PCS23011.1 hypothetical protein BTN49_1339 [Candidatus Enterovibrio escacola]
MKNISTLRISGDFMEVAIFDNGIVVVDTLETKIIDGRVFVYQLEMGYGLNASQLVLMD